MTARPARARRRLAAGAAVLVAAAALQVSPSAAGAAALPRAESLADAQRAAAALRAELDDLRRRSAESIERLEHAEDAHAEAVTRSLQLTREAEAARAEAEGTDRRLGRRISALYRAGGSVGLWVTLLEARSTADLVARKANVDAVVAADVTVRDLAHSDTARLAEVEAAARDAALEATRASAAADAEAAQLTALMAEQEEAVEAASERVRALVEEQRRAAALEAARRLSEERAAAVARARAAGQVSTGAVDVHGDAVDAYAGPPGACPVGPVHSFTDTWHAPRSGGRKHQGTDVFAPYGSPAYAVVDGVIDKWSDGGLGGLAVWLRGDDGDRYYYAHNSANVAPVGARVEAGDVIALVGTSGNAETTPPHIHFQAHPGGGPAANPAPWLAALCG